jgi:hypothetical protein
VAKVLSGLRRRSFSAGWIADTLPAAHCHLTSEVLSSSVNLRLRWRLLFVCTPRRKELLSRIRLLGTLALKNGPHAASLGDLFQEPRARRGASVRGYMILWNLAGAEGSELNNRFRMALAAALPALRAPASDPSDVELASISRPSSSNTCQFQRQPPAESAQGRTLTSKKRYGSTPSIWDACQPFVRAACGPVRRGGAGRRV